METLPLNELGLTRIAPLAVLVITLVYFGWWLRGESIRLLKEWIEELKRK